MAKITQYSRISHHTLAGSASATFSVPATEDFTDGSWTANDLALSEIGVNEDAGKAYIRIGTEIKELEFTGGTAGAESLAATLAVGNTTGANNIIFNNNQAIYNGTNNAYIAFADKLVEINSDISSATNSLFQVQPDFIYLESSDGSGILGSTIKASMSGVVIDTKDFGYGETSSIALTNNTISIGYNTDNDAWYSVMNIDGTGPETKIETGYNSGSLLGRVRTTPGSVSLFAGNATSSTYVSETTTNTSWRVLRVENNIERSEIEVKADGDNHLVNINQTNFMFGTTSTTGFASASIAVLDLPNTGDHCWIKVQVKAISSTFSAGYVADIFGGFRNDGSPNLIGTGYSVIEYTDFTGGAQAFLDISSTRVRVRGLGQTGSTISWSANLTWG